MTRLCHILFVWFLVFAGTGPFAQDDAPIVQRILVEGEQRYSEEVLIKYLGQAVGEPFDGDAVNDGILELWERLRVRATTSYREVDGGIELRLQVVEIPVDLEPRFIGLVSASLEEVLEWAGLTVGEEIFFNEAQRIARNVREGYLRKGHYFCEIDVITREGTADEAPDLIFQVREGPRVHVEEMVVRGNDSFPDRSFLIWRRGLKSIAGVKLKKPFLIFKKAFIEEVLDADLIAMREVYRRKGYLDAIVEVDRLEFSEDRKWVTIHVRVDEGELYTVGSLTIQGFTREEDPSDPNRYLTSESELLFPEADLKEECELLVGEAFEQGRVDQDGRALRTYYGERGYLAHPSISIGQRFDFMPPVLLYDVDKKQVHVTYRLAQGEQQFIREVIFAGATHTQDRVLRRMVTVFPGEQADLKKVASSLSRIDRTGYFLDPQNPAQHRDPTFRFVETDDPAWKDLLFEVEEGSPIGFSFGGGVNTNTGFFGQIQLTIRNFDAAAWPSSLWGVLDEVGSKEAWHGAGQELFIFAQPGNEDRRFRVRFSDPDIFRRHFDAIGLRLEAARTLRVYPSHDERREIASARFTYQTGPDSSLYFGYSHETVDVDDIATSGEPVLTQPLTVPALLKAQEGEFDVSNAEIGWVHSTLDRRIAPRRGHRYNVSANIYDSSLGSDFDFVKTEVGAESYVQFGEDDGSVHPGMRFRLRAGAAFPYGDTEEVPYTERFFLGGNSLRGFRIRGVGPNEQGFPVGGETYVAASVEYRVPFYTVTRPGTFVEDEALRGFVFMDAGVIGTESMELDFDETRVSAGFGLGISLGPLPMVLTFGFPIKDGVGDVSQTFTFNLGF